MSTHGGAHGGAKKKRYKKRRVSYLGGTFLAPPSNLQALKRGTKNGGAKKSVRKGGAFLILAARFCAAFQFTRFQILHYRKKFLVCLHDLFIQVTFTGLLLQLFIVL